MNEELKIALEAFLNVLRESEPLKRYNEAKEAYVADGHLIALVNQYNVQGQLLRDEGAKPERDQELIGQITAKLKELYDEILRNEHMLAMQEAEQAVSEIVTEINHGVQSIVQPEAVEGGACGGNCSSCKGCH